MLTSQATSARDVLRFTRSSLARGLTSARSGQITLALTDLDGVRADPDAVLSDLDRAALLTTSIDCRLARGELSEALALGEQLGCLLDDPGPAGATAHHGRGELSAATGESDLAAAHFSRIARLRQRRRRRPRPAALAGRRCPHSGPARAPLGERRPRPRAPRPGPRGRLGVLHRPGTAHPGHRRPPCRRSRPAAPGARHPRRRPGRPTRRPDQDRPRRTAAARRQPGGPGRAGSAPRGRGVRRERGTLAAAGPDPPAARTARPDAACRSAARRSPP